MDGAGLCSDYVEIGLQFNTTHSHRVFNSFFIVHYVILRHYMNDLAARRYNNPVHIFCKPVNILDTNLVFFRCTGYASMMNRTSNVLTGNTHVYYTNINARHIAGFPNSLFNGKHCFINVGNYSFYYAFRFGFTQT